MFERIVVLLSSLFQVRRDSESAGSPVTTRQKTSEGLKTCLEIHQSFFEVIVRKIQVRCEPLSN